MKTNRVTKGLTCIVVLLSIGPSFLAAVGTVGVADAPRVSHEIPEDASQHISVYLPELSFMVRDPEDDDVHFTVVTRPDFIGGQYDGTISKGTVHIPRRNGALANSTSYTWWVNATDGTSWTNNTYSFTTVNDSFRGYTLFTPLGGNTTSTFLIDDYGNIVHTWQARYPATYCVYMTEDGSIIRPCIVHEGESPGLTRKIQKIAWNGTLLWDYQYSSDDYWQTHDVRLLPNGNVLILALERKTGADAIAAGRNPALLTDNELWPGCIVEVRPTNTTSGEIIWEWHLWDHLIQDFDPTKANYGVVAQHPELLDINFALNGNQDWFHPNTICYNPALDQIILCSRHMGEFYIIDHNTTTLEASQHTGGAHRKGGDFLYRWGNPKSYRAGNDSNQTLFGPHDAQWIPTGQPGEGNILIFNNGWKRPDGNYSSIDEIKPPMNSQGGYEIYPGQAYGPKNLTWRYTAPNPYSFYAEFISGCQRLPSGNTLICDGPHGHFFEVTKNGETVWSYKNNLSSPDNMVFRVRRYYAPFCPPAAPDLSGSSIGRAKQPYNLTCTTTDPEGNNVYYMVNWGDDTPLTWLGPYQSGKHIMVNHTWHNEQHYLIKVIAKDAYGSIGPSSVMTAHIGTPYEPTDPIPEDGETSVDVNVHLQWTGGDPDPEDIVTYDVFFGATDPPPKIVENQTETFFLPGTLTSNRTYYWKIIAWDNHAVSTAGPLWRFTTKADTTPPVTTVSLQGTMGDNRWFVSPVLVSLNATDTESGVNHTMYRIDQNPWQVYIAPFMVSVDGNHTLTYYSVDNLGNEEQPKITALKIDQVPPITRCTLQGHGSGDWYHDIIIILDAFDNTSGVNHTYFKLHGADPWSEYTGPGITPSIEGFFDLYFYSVDKAGNIEQTKGPITIQFDPVPPSITLNVVSENLQKTKWLLNATASDDCSGVHKVEFYIDNQLQGTVYAWPYEWHYEGDGSTAYAVAYDNAGNSQTSPIVTCQVLLPSIVKAPLTEQQALKIQMRILRVNAVWNGQ